MAYFEWVDELIIDQGNIDKEHRKLVELINDLYDAAFQGLDRVKVGSIMAELVFYTQDHLLNEEEVMAAVGFPDLAAHKRDHVQFLAMLQDIQSKFNLGQTTSATQLAETLKVWLSNHICEADAKLRQYLGDVEEIELG